MVGDARLLMLLPFETRQVVPDNTIVLTSKPADQTWSRLTQLKIVVYVRAFFFSRSSLRTRLALRARLAFALFAKNTKKLRLFCRLDESVTSRR